VADVKRVKMGLLKLCKNTVKCQISIDMSERFFVNGQRVTQYTNKSFNFQDFLSLFFCFYCHVAFDTVIEAGKSSDGFAMKEAKKKKSTSLISLLHFALRPLVERR
jgi:hypothetical protein